MTSGPDQRATEPDLRVPGWEKILPGINVGIDADSFERPRVLEIADVNGELMGHVVRNIEGNKEEKSATFWYPTGEKIILPIPADPNAAKTYPFPDTQFELKLYGDGSAVLSAYPDGKGVSYQLIDQNLDIDQPGCVSVSVGEDDEFDGVMEGNRPVAFSTQHLLGLSKYPRVNEDNVGFNRKTVVVADGMGSAYAPELASKYIVDAFLSGENDLASVFVTARHIFKHYFSHYLLKEGEQSDTVFAVARLKDGDKIDLLSVGDARWRLVRGGKVLLSSHDDSYVQLLKDAGKITEREKYTSTKRNIVISSLMTGDPQIVSDVQTQPGDMLILCSDGMDALTDEEMAEIVTKFPPKEAVEEMNRRVTERNTHFEKNAFLPEYLRDFHDGQSPMLVSSPMDNGTVAIVRL